MYRIENLPVPEGHPVGLRPSAVPELGGVEGAEVHDEFAISHTAPPSQHLARMPASVNGCTVPCVHVFLAVQCV